MSDGLTKAIAAEMLHMALEGTTGERRERVRRKLLNELEKEHGIRFRADVRQRLQERTRYELFADVISEALDND